MIASDIPKKFKDGRYFRFMRYMDHLRGNGDFVATNSEDVTEETGLSFVEQMQFLKWLHSVGAVSAPTLDLKKDVKPTYN